jgi:HlyD family type I secretion membrane fusion protein
LADHSDDPRVQAAYDNQLELFEARRDEITRQIAILEEQVRQYELQVAGMEAEQVANRDQLRLIREELTGLRELAEKGLVALPRVRALDRERSRLEGEYAARETEIARANVAAGEIQLQILKVTRDREREILAELGDVRSELTEIREQLKSARDALKRTVLIAPVGGQVIELMVHTIGGVVRAGERILDIVPRGERLIVEARVRPLDADTVRAGQPAHVVFTGLPKRTAPHLSARVMSISSDAVTDPQTGEEYFLARVRIDDADMAHISEANIVSGMPADVLIRAGERTLLGYLIAPWVELFGKAMHEY